MKLFNSVLVSLFLLIACSNRSANHETKNNQDPIQLKVAAYNVEAGEKATATEIGEALKPYDFDIVCFSEAPGGSWTKKVSDVLGLEYEVIGRYSTAGQKNKYKSIVCKTPLFDYKEILMYDTLHTATKAQTIVGGKKIAIYAVHFPFGWRNANHIIETTEKIDDFTFYLKGMQQDEISIVMGDFNLTLNSLHYQRLKNVGLQSVWGGLELDVSQLSSMVAGRQGHVIDHIMYNPGKVRALDGQIIEMKKPLSDHKPVWALLQLKE